MKDAVVASVRTRALSRPASGVAALLASLLFAGGASASEVQVGGQLDHRLFYSLEPSAVTQNETRYELTLDARPGTDARVHLSWKGSLPFADDPGFPPPGSQQEQPRREVPAPFPSPPELQEAYLDVYLSAADLRVGRQVVNWGTADGINPTNVINPRSFSVEALMDRETPGTPVPAVRLSGDVGNALGLTAVGVLDFVPAPFPKDQVKRLAAEVAHRTTGTLVPDGTWLSYEGVGPGNQYEWALRAEGMVAGYDVYVSYFNGYTDLPALWLEATTPQFQVKGRYRRQQQFGLAAAGVVADAGVWLEAAYTLPERLPELDEAPVALSPNEGTWQAVAGSDYTFPNDVYASAQVVYNQAGSLLLPYAPRSPKAEMHPQAGLYGLGWLQYAPAEFSAAWDAVAVVNLRDGGTVVSPGLTYQLTPGAKLVLRYVDVVGGDASEFGALRPYIRGVAARVEVAF